MQKERNIKPILRTACVFPNHINNFYSQKLKRTFSFKAVKNLYFSAFSLQYLMAKSRTRHHDILFKLVQESCKNGSFSFNLIRGPFLLPNFYNAEYESSKIQNFFCLIAKKKNLKRMRADFGNLERDQFLPIMKELRKVRISSCNISADETVREMIPSLLHHSGGSITTLVLQGTYNIKDNPLSLQKALRYMNQIENIQLECYVHQDKFWSELLNSFLELRTLKNFWFNAGANQEFLKSVPEILRNNQQLEGILIKSNNYYPNLLVNIYQELPNLKLLKILEMNLSNGWNSVILNQNEGKLLGKALAEMESLESVFIRLRANQVEEGYFETLESFFRSHKNLKKIKIELQREGFNENIINCIVGSLLSNSNLEDLEIKVLNNPHINKSMLDRFSERFTSLVNLKRFSLSIGTENTEKVIFFELASILDRLQSHEKLQTFELSFFGNMGISANQLNNAMMMIESCPSMSEFKFELTGFQSLTIDYLKVLTTASKALAKLKSFELRLDDCNKLNIENYFFSYMANLINVEKFSLSMKDTFDRLQYYHVDRLVSSLREMKKLKEFTLDCRAFSADFLSWLPSAFINKTSLEKVTVYSYPRGGAGLLMNRFYIDTKLMTKVHICY